MGPPSDSGAHPFPDHDLARRLERAEAATNAAFVDARGELDPGVGSGWIDVAGVYALFDGVGSPLTQTFGLGLFDPVGGEELDQIEAFFRGRGAPVLHEVSPYLPAETLGELNRRGYRPVEFSTVLVRPIGGGFEDVLPPLALREIEGGEEELWSRVAAEGWRSESAELGDFMEAFGQVVTRARGVHCFLAELEGRPIAAATLSIHGTVALLAGASTIPEGRRRGAQNALLRARLRFAAARGAELAMMAAQPGSGSQRNAQRQGFRVAYTRMKWELPEQGAGGNGRGEDA